MKRFIRRRGSDRSEANYLSLRPKLWQSVIEHLLIFSLFGNHANISGLRKDNWIFMPTSDMYHGGIFY